MKAIEIADSIKDAIKKMEENGEDMKPEIVPSYFAGINGITGGGYRPGITIIAGAPGSNKSTFALAEARHQIELGYTVLYISTEENVKYIFANTVLSRLPVPIKTEDLLSGLVMPDEADNVAKEFVTVRSLGLEIIDSINQTTEIEQEIKSTKPDIVYIDSLQSILPAHPNGDQVHDVAAAITELNSIANSCGIHLMIISHLNRKGAETGSSDINSLAYSSKIGYYASTILMLTPQKLSGSVEPIEVRIEKSRTVDICSCKSRKTEIVKRVDTRCLKDSPIAEKSAQANETSDLHDEKLAGREKLLALLEARPAKGGPDERLQ